MARSIGVCQGFRSEGQQQGSAVISEAALQLEHVTEGLLCNA